MLLEPICLKEIGSCPIKEVLNNFSESKYLFPEYNLALVESINDVIPSNSGISFSKSFPKVSGIFDIIIPETKLKTENKILVLNIPKFVVIGLTTIAPNLESK